MVFGNDSSDGGSSCTVAMAQLYFIRLEDRNMVGEMATWGPQSSTDTVSVPSP